MSRLTELISQAKAKDRQLGEDLEREFRALSSRRAFGLNFERHRPEVVELCQRPVRKGDKVRILPERGSTKSGDQRLWLVRNIGEGESPSADIEPLVSEERETRQAQVDDLVVIAEFRDFIYPGLVSTGKVERGGDKPFHTVINGENFHALEALTYTHRGRVDAIYIDPPYNSGARDWKYNNDYVEADDLYKHSKWLAMMERRLRLAHELLNPANSVLIVTIDEKEYLRLGLLLEQLFSDATQIQMVTTVIKPGGTSRTKEFSRVEEYIFFVFFGAAEIARTADNMLGLHERPTTAGLSDSDLWEGMVRRGIGVVRSQRPKQFYPIFVDPTRRAIVDAGTPLAAGQSRDDVAIPDGLVAVWPIKDDLTEGFWQLSPEGLEKARRQGTVRVGSINPKTGQWRIQYMKAKKARAVLDGSIEVVGHDANGVVILDLANGELEALSTPRGGSPVSRCA